MALEALPPLGDAELRALGQTLERVGLRLDEKPEAHRSAWRRAAALEAVDNQPAPVRYAPPSPRSTRGATRA